MWHLTATVPQQAPAAAQVGTHWLRQHQHYSVNSSLAYSGQAVGTAGVWAWHEVYCLLVCLPVTDKHQKVCTIGMTASSYRIAASWRGAEVWVVLQVPCLKCARGGRQEKWSSQISTPLHKRAPAQAELMLPP